MVGVGIGLGLAGLVPLSGAAGDDAIRPPRPTSSAAAQRPPAPPAWNPVHVFRQLLAMSPSERHKILEEKGDKQRQYLEARFREFDGMGPADRELRLRFLELQWYLLPLMKRPASERGLHVEQVPEPWRALVKERLVHWDRLPPEQQRELLSNENALTRFPRTSLAATNQGTSATTTSTWPEHAGNLESDLAHWRALPEEQRHRISDNFDRLFSLTDRQRERGMRHLTDVEKHQVQVLFATFSRLTPDQRAKCLEAFNQFANMTPAERSHFLSNAARWKAMSPEEQRVWRTLTGQLPPAPPGFPSLAPSPPTPPMPQKPDGAVGTNRQAGL